MKCIKELCQTSLTPSEFEDIPLLQKDKSLESENRNSKINILQNIIPF